MSPAHDLLWPDTLKLLLAATLLIPVFFIIVVAGGFPYDSLLLPAAVTVIVSYAAACGIDYAVESRTAKIAIASVAALVSILLGSLLVRGMTMICDPVHDPGMVCDPVHVPEPTTIPAVVTTVQPATTTPLIFDPVHDPGSCSGDVCQVAPGIATGIVAEKLEACRKQCGR